jgi:hypothetical protein
MDSIEPHRDDCDRKERDESGGTGDGVAAGSRRGGVQEEAAAQVEMDHSLGFRVLNKTSSSTSTNPLTGVMSNHPVWAVFSFSIQPNRSELVFK